MKSIEEIYAEAEKGIDAMRLTIHLHAAEYSALSRFIESLHRPDVDGGTYGDIGYQTGWCIRGLIVQVHLTKEESFKDAEPILTWFLDRGWTQCGQSEDANWGVYSMGYRQVEFKKTGHVPMFWEHKSIPSLEMRATVRMWPHRDGVTCKKVEDGVEKKYKFVCQES